MRYSPVYYSDDADSARAFEAAIRNTPGLETMTTRRRGHAVALEIENPAARGLMVLVDNLLEALVGLFPRGDDISRGRQPSR